MSNVYHSETIKRLLVAAITGSITDEERALLDEWRKESPSHEALYRKVTDVAFLQEAVANDEREAARRSWEKVSRRIRSHRSILRPAIAVAAGVAVVVGLGIYGSMQYAEGEASSSADTHVQAPASNADKEPSAIERVVSIFRPKKAQPRIVSVQRGEMHAMHLADNTNVDVNSESEIVIPADFSPTNRTVSLVGEAYFRVRKDALHPFVIHTGDVAVKVLGTNFNVKNYPEDDHMYVTLEEGSVQVTGTDSSVTLSPGMQAVVDCSGKVEVREVDVEQHCGWHLGTIIYSNARLEDILTELGRWYDFRASFSSDHLRNMHFTMRIDRAKDFNRIIEMIENMEKVTIRRVGSDVIVTD